MLEGIYRDKWGRSMEIPWGLILEDYVVGKFAEKYNTSISTSKDGLHNRDNFITTETKITSLMRRIDVLKEPSTHQVGQIN